MQTTFQRGQLVEKYKLVEILGAGGMGEVWLAKEPGLPSPVAIKFLLAQYLEAQNIRERFEEEARVLSQLETGPIVGIKTIVWPKLPDGRAVGGIVMQFLGGGSVEEMMEQRDQHDRPVLDADGYAKMQALSFTGPLPYKERRFDEQANTLTSSRRERLGGVQKLAVDALTALEFVHKKGIVHRDIKPSNLMLTPEGEIRLADFGISRSSGARRQLTQMYQPIGTPDYMSPEQAMGLAVDARSDIYSFGVVLYQMLTGRLPYQDGSLDRFTPVNTGQSDVDARMNQILEKALSRNAADRWQSSRDFAGALAEIHKRTPTVAMDASPKPAQRQPSPQPAPPPPAPRSNSKAIGAAVALVAVAGLLWFILRSPATDNAGPAGSPLLEEARTFEQQGQPCRALDKAREAESEGRSRQDSKLTADAGLFISRLDPACQRRKRSDELLAQARGQEPCTALKTAEQAVAADSTNKEAATFRGQMRAACNGGTTRDQPPAPTGDPAVERVRGALARRDCAAAKADLPNVRDAATRAALAAEYTKLCPETAPPQTPPAQPGPDPAVTALMQEVASLRKAGKYCTAVEKLKEHHDNGGAWPPVLAASLQRNENDCNN